jgi:hypothetical protein
VNVSVSIKLHNKTLWVWWNDKYFGLRSILLKLLTNLEFLFYYWALTLWANSIGLEMYRKIHVKYWSCTWSNGLLKFMARKVAKYILYLYLEPIGKVVTCYNYYDMQYENRNWYSGIINTLWHFNMHYWFFR